MREVQAKGNALKAGVCRTGLGPEGCSRAQREKSTCRHVVAGAGCEVATRRWLPAVAGAATTS